MERYINMEINTRDAGEVKVVSLSGELDTNTAPDAASCFNELLESGTLKILVNFEKLEYTSSAGLRVLLEVGQRLEEAEGKLKVCCLNDTVEEVFDMSGFTMLLNVCESEEEALASF
jgi:anti-anti-sigma factor